MTLLMKLISVGFDTENNHIKSPITMLEIFGYILNPASVIFGPFITFKDYNQIFEAHPMVGFRGNVTIYKQLPVFVLAWCFMHLLL